MKKLLTGLSVAGLLGIAVAAFAQSNGVPNPYGIASPTGLEQINVNNTGPYIATITLNQARNAQGYLLVPTGTTVNTTVPNTAAVVAATGTITTWNIVLPTAPYDGELVKASCPGGAASTVAITATLPASVAIVGTAYTACTASPATDAAFIYNASGNTWYRTE